MRPADAVRMITLAALWGASYLFMRVAVPHTGVAGMVEGRTLAGGLVMAAFLAARGIAFRARLVGGGVLLHEHRRLVERMGLAGRVEVMGFVPDVMAELRAADVFALHTLQEGSGSMALLEALQTGLPGVVTAVDGLVEDVADGQEALLVPPADAPAFAAALERLVSDRALRLAMGARARATFERRFAAGPFADALGRVYAEVLAEGEYAHRRRQA